MPNDAPETLLLNYYKENKDDLPPYNEFVKGVLDYAKEGLVEGMANHLYNQKYSHMDREVFDERIGLKAWRDSQPSFFDNIGLGIMESAASIGAGTVEFADSLGSFLDKWVPLGGFQKGYYADDGEFVVSDEGKWQFVKGADLAIDRKDDWMSEWAAGLFDFEAGYEPSVAWEEIKDVDNLKENPLIAIPFAIEQGLISIPHMVMAVSSLPVYVMARTGEMGKERSLNDLKEDASMEDLVKAFPWATAEALLERVGAKGVFGLGDDALKGTGVRDYVTAVKRASAKELATEAVQNPLELMGTQAGTVVGDPTAGELGEAAAQGALVGGIFGGTARGVTAGGEALGIKVAEMQKQQERQQQQKPGKTEPGTEQGTEPPPATDPDAGGDFTEPGQEAQPGDIADAVAADEAANGGSADFVPINANDIASGMDVIVVEPVRGDGFAMFRPYYGKAQVSQGEDGVTFSVTDKQGNVVFESTGVDMESALGNIYTYQTVFGEDVFEEGIETGQQTQTEPEQRGIGEPLQSDVYNFLNDTGSVGSMVVARELAMGKRSVKNPKMLKQGDQALLIDRAGKQVAGTVTQPYVSGKQSLWVEDRDGKVHTFENPGAIVGLSPLGEDVQQESAEMQEFYSEVERMIDKPETEWGQHAKTLDKIVRNPLFMRLPKNVRDWIDKMVFAVDQIPSAEEAAQADEAFGAYSEEVSRILERVEAKGVDEAMARSLQKIRDSELFIGLDKDTKNKIDDAISYVELRQKVQENPQDYLALLEDGGIALPEALREELKSIVAKAQEDAEPESGGDTGTTTGGGKPKVRKKKSKKGTVEKPDREDQETSEQTEENTGTTDEVAEETVVSATPYLIKATKDAQGYPKGQSRWGAKVSIKQFDPAPKTAAQFRKALLDPGLVLDITAKSGERWKGKVTGVVKTGNPSYARMVIEDQQKKFEAGEISEDDMADYSDEVFGIVDYARVEDETTTGEPDDTTTEETETETEPTSLTDDPAFTELPVEQQGQIQVIKDTHENVASKKPFPEHVRALMNAMRELTAFQETKEHEVLADDQKGLIERAVALASKVALERQVEGAEERKKTIEDVGVKIPGARKDYYENIEKKVGAEKKSKMYQTATEGEIIIRELAKNKILKLKEPTGIDQVVWYFVNDTLIKRSIKDFTGFIRQAINKEIEKQPHESRLAKHKAYRQLDYAKASFHTILRDDQQYFLKDQVKLKSGRYFRYPDFEDAMKDNLDWIREMGERYSAAIAVIKESLNREVAVTVGMDTYEAMEHLRQVMFGLTEGMNNVEKPKEGEETIHFRTSSYEGFIPEQLIISKEIVDKDRKFPITLIHTRPLTEYDLQNKIVDHYRALAQSFDSPMFEDLQEVANNYQLSYTEYERVVRQGLSEQASSKNLQLIDSLRRVGPDWRQGQDVSAEQLRDTFNFSSISFGNWVGKTKERQKLVNLAYDSFMDLAHILDVEPEIIGLGSEAASGEAGGFAKGGLAIAFGERGRPGAAAHYEPWTHLINMTRRYGAGALAHEWGHALDFRFGRLGSTETGYVGKGKETGREIKTTDPFIDTLTEEFYDYYTTTYKAEELNKAVDAFNNAKTLEDKQKAFSNIVSDQGFYRKLTYESPMYAGAKAKKGGQSYWTRSTEMFARAFETFIYDKAKEKGITNEYLFRELLSDKFQSLVKSVYPTGAHRKHLAISFEMLSKYLTLDEAKRIVLNTPENFQSLMRKEVVEKEWKELKNKRLKELGEDLNKLIDQLGREGFRPEITPYQRIYPEMLKINVAAMKTLVTDDKGDYVAVEERMTKLADELKEHDRYMELKEIKGVHKVIHSWLTQSLQDALIEPREYLPESAQLRAGEPATHLFAIADASTVDGWKKAMEVEIDELHIKRIKESDERDERANQIYKKIYDAVTDETRSRMVFWGGSTGLQAVVKDYIEEIPDPETKKALKSEVKEFSKFDKKEKAASDKTVMDLKKKIYDELPDDEKEGHWKAFTEDPNDFRIYALKNMMRSVESVPQKYVDEMAGKAEAWSKKHNYPEIDAAAHYVTVMQLFARYGNGLLTESKTKERGIVKSMNAIRSELGKYIGLPSRSAMIDGRDYVLDEVSRFGVYMDSFEMQYLSLYRIVREKEQDRVFRDDMYSWGSRMAFEFNRLYDILHAHLQKNKPFKTGRRSQLIGVGGSSGNILNELTEDQSLENALEEIDKEHDLYEREEDIPGYMRKLLDRARYDIGYLNHRELLNLAVFIRDQIGAIILKGQSATETGQANLLMYRALNRTIMARLREIEKQQNDINHFLEPRGMQVIAYNFAEEPDDNMNPIPIEWLVYSTRQNGKEIIEGLIQVLRDKTGEIWRWNLDKRYDSPDNTLMMFPIPGRERRVPGISFQNNPDNWLLEDLGISTEQVIQHEQDDGFEWGFDPMWAPSGVDNETVSDKVKELIRRGRDSPKPMSERSMDLQIMDIARILHAYNTDAGAFVLSLDPGSGKTFVISGAMRDLMLNQDVENIVFATPSQNSLNQNIADIEGFFSDLRTNKKGKDKTNVNSADYHGLIEIKDPDGHARKLLVTTANELNNLDLFGVFGENVSNNYVLVYDESHSLVTKSVTGTKKADALKTAEDFIAGSKFTIFSSGTPFKAAWESWYVSLTGAFGDPITFYNRFGVGVGRSGALSDRATDRHNYLFLRDMTKRGMYYYRPKEIDTSLVTFSHEKMDLDPESLGVYFKVDEILADAYEAAESYEVASTINFRRPTILKNLVEPLKYRASVQKAKDIVDKGEGNRVLLFVNTINPSWAGRFAPRGDYVKNNKDFENRHYTAQEVLDLMADTNDPIFSEDVVEIAGAYVRAGFEYELPKLRQVVKEIFGDEGVFFFTGKETKKYKEENLAKFRTGGMRFMVSTYQSGGTAINIHDTIGKYPLTMIKNTTPNTEKMFKQAIGRGVREQMASAVDIVSMFAHQALVEYKFMANLLRNMRSLGVTTSGEVPEEVRRMEEWLTGVEEGTDTDDGDKLMAMPSPRVERIKHNLTAVDLDHPSTEVKRYMEIIESLAKKLVPDYVPIKFVNENKAYYGKYTADGKILVNMAAVFASGRAAVTPEHLIGHESIHALKSFGLITGEEFQTLIDALKERGLDEDYFKRVWSGVYEPTSDGSMPALLWEEAVAEDFGEYLRAREAGATTSKWDRVIEVYERVYQFFKRLWGYVVGVFKKTGETNSEAERRVIYDMIATGRMKDRMPVVPPGYVVKPIKLMPMDPGKHRFTDPQVNREYEEASKRYGQSTAVQVMKERLMRIWHLTTRHRPSIEQGPKLGRFNAEFIEKARHLEAGPGASIFQIEAYMKRTLAKLDDTEFDLFSKYVFVTDLKYTLDQGMEIPFFDEDSIEVELNLLRDYISQYPRVQAALDSRDAFADTIRDDLVKEGVLNAKQVENRDYVKHIVLEFVNLEGTFSPGGGQKVVNPFQHRREGHEGAISTDLLAVDTEWMFRALSDIATGRFLNWLKDSKYNYHRQFFQMAVARNNRDVSRKLVSEAIRHGFGSLLKEKGLDEKSLPGHVVRAIQLAKNADKSGVLAAKTDTMPLYSQWMAHNKTIAIYFSRLSKAIGNLDESLMRDIPEFHLGNIIQLMTDLAGVKAKTSQSHVDYGESAEGKSIFSTITWLADRTSPEWYSVSRIAGGLLGAIGRRRTWVSKDVIPDTYINPLSRIQLSRAFGQEMREDKRDFKTDVWQADSYDGKTVVVNMFTAKTLSDHTFNKVMAQMNELLKDTDLEGVVDGEVSAALEELMRYTMRSMRDEQVVGGPKEQMILPDYIIEALNTFRDPYIERLLTIMTDRVTRELKQWLILNPRRGLMYNLRNVLSDLSSAVMTPAATGYLKHVPSAFRELKEVLIDGEAPTPLIQEALRTGAISSGATSYEVLNDAEYYFDRHGDPMMSRVAKNLRVPADESAMQKLTKMPLRAYQYYMRQVRSLTVWREQAFRYAAFKHFHQEIVVKGRTPKDMGFGVTPPYIIEGLPDKMDLAARMARDAMGDYPNISLIGRRARRNLLLFWSWVESNAIRYLNRFRNIGYEFAYLNQDKGFSTRAAIAAVNVSRVFFVTGMIMLWNLLFFADEEEELSEEERLRLHVNLGRGDDGQVQFIRLEDSTTDFFGWIGYEEVGAMIAETAKGRAEYSDVLKTLVKAPAQRVVGSINPIYKTPLELAQGKNYFPDFMNPTSIRDPWQHLMRLMSLDNEYAAFSRNFLDRPVSGPPYLSTWKKVLVSEKHPGELAYNEIRSKAYKFSQGEKERKTRLLYEYGKSKKAGDADSERLAREQLIELYGGREEGLARSMKNKMPLSNLSKAQRKEFIKTLTAAELNTLNNAMLWWKETYGPFPRKLPGFGSPVPQFPRARP